MYQTGKREDNVQTSSCDDYDHHDQVGQYQPITAHDSLKPLLGNKNGL
jgi:hypothetical protein